MTTSTAAIVDEQLTAPVVGVDVGGTKIAAALVSADGGLLGPVAEAPTPAREGAQAVLDAIASSVTTLIDTGAPAAGGPVLPTRHRAVQVPAQGGHVEPEPVVADPVDQGGAHAHEALALADLQARVDHLPVRGPAAGRAGGFGSRGRLR